MTTTIEDSDTSLKPRVWDEMVGQDKLKRKLKLIGDYAKDSQKPLSPILLDGPPGAGKSSLAALVAQQAGVPFMDMMITPDFKMVSINRVLMEFEGLLFLDEIQNIPRSKQGSLYSVLNENNIRLDNGKIIPIENKISIMAATTDKDKLNDALMSRFDTLRFAKYTSDEMSQIVKVLCTRLEVTCTDENAAVLGRASAGSPRQARRLCLMAQRLAGMSGGEMDPELVLEFCEVTRDGLTEEHLIYLESLKKLGGTSGVDTLCNHAQLTKGELFKLERLLIDRDIVDIGQNGRSLLMPGLAILKREGRIEE